MFTNRRCCLIKINLRPPNSEDGFQIHQLIAACPPLDTNSSYCNLLQCTHFSASSVLAETSDKTTIGFVSGYRIPDNPETLFIWQVAVSEIARGQGLAYKMIKDILARIHSQTITHIETSITKDNAASWAMFTSLAKQLNANIKTSIFFDESTHFNKSHPSEYLLTIGPIH